MSLLETGSKLPTLPSSLKHAVMHAVRISDVKALALLLDIGISLDFFDDDGRNILDIVPYLLV